MTQDVVRVGFIGTGGMARSHIRRMLKQLDTTQVAAVCEPSAAAYALTSELFTEADLPAPPNEPEFEQFLANYADKLDAVFIITPHVYHHNQAKACLEAGLDVLLEKPMVMTAEEAESLIETRDRTGKLLVVAFNGSLSPEIRKAVDMLRSGEVGELLSISGTIWQSWGENTVGAWRQIPEVAGGGFMFDTGAHMLNTLSDLAGEDFDEVAAWLDNKGRPVETMAVVMGRLKSGAMITIHGCGESVPDCSSDIRVFTTQAILRTGAWGGYLDIQPHGSREFEPVDIPKSEGGAWEQFIAVRQGGIPNPCPPEVGLRMARLWDAIKESAANNGAPVKC